ncbi:MAG: alkaline phosphatase D family protein [Chitinophagaceae bacterium]|jgi:alkaline phosphatase D
MIESFCRILKERFVGALLMCCPAMMMQAQDVHFTNGGKVLDVTGTEATVWTRLCADAKPNPVVHQREKKVFRHPVGFDEKMPIEQMDGGVRGAAGEVRFLLEGAGRKDSCDWMATGADKDFTAYRHFSGLRPGTSYAVILEGRSAPKGRVTRMRLTFKTVPDDRKPVLITTSTCQYFWSFDDSSRGFRTYTSMQAMRPDLFVQTGDYVYYDKPGPMATDAAKARHKWHAMDAWPSIRAFYETTPAYLLKDDHDLLADDVHPSSKPFGSLTVPVGLSIWRENVPLRGKPYRTLTWGRDLQIWFLEGREFRSPNNQPDGPEKTIWGAEQKDWLQKTLRESSARWKIVFSPTPIVGPDRSSKKDNHANAVYQHEGEWARHFLAAQGAIIVNGDRHWQYVSRDSATGLWEFGSGPVSDFHAQGWPPDERRPEHRFLRVAGGYLSIRMQYEGEKPVLIFTHHDVDGRMTHTERIDTPPTPIKP